LCGIKAMKDSNAVAAHVDEQTLLGSITSKPYGRTNNPSKTNGDIRDYKVVEYHEIVK
jgi:hypothetical protein